MTRKEGYYWVRLLGEYEPKDPIIGYSKGTNPDITYPWQLIGSDEIFLDTEVEVLGAVTPLEKQNA